MRTSRLFHPRKSARGGGRIVTGRPCDAAAQLVRDLTAFAYLPGLLRYTVEGPATAWGAATTSLRPATDLLAKLHNFDGAIRTADALQLEDPTCRAAGLTGIGELTCTVLRAEWDLAVRAGQAGMAREDLDRLLPDLSPLQPTVRALIRRRRTRLMTQRSLLELGKAPAVRYGEGSGIQTPAGRLRSPRGPERTLGALGRGSGTVRVLAVR